MVSMKKVDRGKVTYEEAKERSRKKILDALEMGPATFTELLPRARLSRVVLSKRLEDLAKEGLIEREYKGPRKWLIKLSEKALDPIERTLGRLRMVAPFDVERARELLRDVATLIVEIYWEISHFGPPLINKREPIKSKPITSTELRAMKKSGVTIGRVLRFQPKIEDFNEIMLLTVLACYLCERNWVQRATKKRFVLPIIERKKMLAQFNELLGVISPLAFSNTLAGTFFQHTFTVYLYSFRGWIRVKFPRLKKVKPMKLEKVKDLDVYPPRRFREPEA